MKGESGGMTASRTIVIASFDKPSWRELAHHHSCLKFFSRIKPEICRVWATGCISIYLEHKGMIIYASQVPIVVLGGKYLLDRTVSFIHDQY